MTNKPVQKFKFGAIEIAIWKNEKDGKTWYSYTLQKSYKEGEEWKTTQNFSSKTDLMNVGLCVMEAMKWKEDK